ncbi:glycosyltransferase family 4 protein [Ornithinimicrobium panacihumi]|uniref:glycosyltransferase family 4 protein n=1 Tax=Ornithinimicrobium panacihumi TaxID=2008449 RepID=UPI003F8C1A4D
MSICHNDALAGDVYVNHGVLTSAMRARGYFAWRMVRNPLHLFTTARDIYRYRAGTHRVVVNLSEADQATVVHRYRLTPARAWVIPNGVHLDRFVPPTEAERKAARAAHGIPSKARVAAFVGHEFERKGLPLLLEAASELADHHVIVVGGTSQQVDAQRALLTSDLAARVHWFGRVPDPRLALAAADVLVLPSAYEANPLVVLEALATGLQVVSTPVGSNPQTLVDPMVCRIVDRKSGAVRAGLEELAAVPLPRAEIAERARELAARSSWPLVAARYLELFSDLVEREGA